MAETSHICRCVCVYKSGLKCDSATMKWYTVERTTSYIASECPNNVRLFLAPLSLSKYDKIFTVWSVI